MDVASTAATYNPFWYYIAGNVAAPFSGDNFLLALRVANIFFVGVILFFALIQASGSDRPAWPLAGVTLAFTPIFGYSTTVAAPNAVTYAAGVLLWTSALRVASDSTPFRGSWVGVGVGASLVMLTHTTGLIFVPIVGVCIAFLLWPRRSLLAKKSLRQFSIVLVSVTVVGALCAAWVLSAGTNDPRDSGDSFDTMPPDYALRGPFLWFLQSIATLTFRNEGAPVLVYAIGAAVIFPLLALAARYSSNFQRWCLAGIVLSTFGVPLLLTLLTYENLGEAWQGRYALPLSVGAVLVSTHVLSTATALRDNWVLPSILASGLVATHGLTVIAMIRALRGPVSSTQALFVVTLSLLAGGLIVWSLRTAAARGQGTLSTLVPTSSN